MSSMVQAVRDPWTTQLSRTDLCKSSLSLMGSRSLDSSGFHKDLTTNLELGTFPSAFLIENTTSAFYLDLAQIKEGLYLGLPPVFADGPISVEESADEAPSHLVGVLCQTHHVTLPIHHRYQAAGNTPYQEACLPSPRVFVAMVTTESGGDDLEGAIERVEEERGCRLLRAPCGVTREPTCGWEEISFTGVGEVCSTIPVGLLSDLDLVKISTYGAVVFGVVAILYTLFSSGQRAEKKIE